MQDFKQKDFLSWIVAIILVKGFFKLGIEFSFHFKRHWDCLGVLMHRTGSLIFVDGIFFH